jgi:hypothetical protein
MSRRCPIAQRVFPCLAAWRLPADPLGLGCSPNNDFKAICLNAGGWYHRSGRARLIASSRSEWGDDRSGLAGLENANPRGRA